MNSQNAAAEAAFEFSRKGSYLSHPQVRPYRGTANGDTEAAWERDYFVALAREVLEAAHCGPYSPDVDWLANIIRINSGDHLNPIGAGALAEKIVDALKNTAPQVSTPSQSPAKEGVLPAEPVSEAGKDSGPVSQPLEPR